MENVKHIQVKLTPEDWRKYKRLAIEEGMTLQDYVKKALETQERETENTIENLQENNNGQEE